ncbi:17279_t:CDS:2 [Cetraspora pellucida]|uniref:17279_t:CDS:1 n=1 Tax=Cetraspora pellucida TaxID=1433469 RepID=A0A9N9GJV7_9GLOM|nr:17279_t:CDS:2 [Cetraspora pellucida]
MPRLTSHQKKSRKAYEAKAYKLNTNVNNFEAESSDDIDSFSACDEVVDNNDAVNIMKRLQVVTKKYSHNDDKVELEDYDSDDGLPAHNELIENDDAKNIVKKLQDAANKYYRECYSNQTRRLCYLGNSVRTKRRKKQQQREAAKGTSTLHTFWAQKKSSEETSEAELYNDLEEVDKNDIGGMLENKIEPHNWNKKISTALENLTLDIKKENVKSEVWVRLNSICFYLQLVKSNHQKIKASKIIADAAGKGVYHAKCIRSWAHDYVMTRQIPYSRRGHHAKTWSFLWDEDILLQIKSYVIMLQINEIILPGLGFAPPSTISLSTAKNYLKELGYTYERHRMPIFSGDNMEVETWPDSNIKPLILVTYDKCIFSAYDGSRSLWIPYSEQPLQKKGEGYSIHVSEFLTDICGRLVLPDEMQPSDKFPREACWKAEDLINQVTNYAIPIFEACFPGCQALFAFDNATSHSAFSRDALIANHMNLGPAGKQEKLCSISYFRKGRKYDQNMVFLSDYHIPELRGEAKGLKEVLKKRGLWPEEGLRLKEARELITQKGQLEEIIVAAGHQIIFYPKFHCELNYIETFWALNSVPLPTIRQYARKAFHYMDAYRKGLNGKAAEFAVKKYHSHHRIPDSVLNSIDFD